MRTSENTAGHVRIPLPPGLPDRVDPTLGQGEVVSALGAIAQSLWAGAEILSGGLMAVPEFEAKLGMGLHLFQVTDALLRVDARLRELGAGRQVLAYARNGLDGDLTPGRVLETAYGRYLDQAVTAAADLAAGPGGLGDGPTRRMLLLHLPELTAARDWGTDAARRYREHGPGQSAQAPESGPGRARKALRDNRFITFSHTRDYREKEEAPAGEDERYRADLLEFVRVNRDEIDAIETFALVYFDLMGEVPLPMLHDLASTTWDEVRHALIGQRLLEHMGLDPYAYPCSMIGIEVRSRLGGWDALAQISLFGELNIIAPMRQLAGRAHRRGEPVVANAFDFICSDEALHLKRIRAWLRTHHPLGDLAEIEEHTKRRAGQELEGLGVLGEEYFVGLTSAQIFELLGE